MATFADDFELYGIGDHPPFGGWTSPLLNPNNVTVIAGGTAAGSVASTRAVEIIAGSLIRDLASFWNTATINFACYPTQTNLIQGEPIDVFDFVNGPTPSFSEYVSFLTLRIENDATISCYSGNVQVSPQFLCNSGDVAIRLQTWNFFQINVTFAVSTIFLEITVHVALNGVEIMSRTGFVSAIQIANLLGTSNPNTAPSYNLLRLKSNRLIYDNFTWNSSIQAIVTYPNEGAPEARVTGGNVEIPLLPDDSIVNVFQGVAEFPLLPNNTKMNAFQGVVELILLNDAIAQGLWKVQEY